MGRLLHLERALGLPHHITRFNVVSPWEHGMENWSRSIALLFSLHSSVPYNSESVGKELERTMARTAISVG
jgi:hypothetical protein